MANSHRILGTSRVWHQFKNKNLYGVVKTNLLFKTIKIFVKSSFISIPFKANDSLNFYILPNLRRRSSWMKIVLKTMRSLKMNWEQAHGSIG